VVSRRVSRHSFVEHAVKQHAHPDTTADAWCAFADSYRSTMPVVYRYLYRGTAGDVQLAEELTQATFEVAVRAFGRGQMEALEPAWLQTVARSRLIDHYRRARREKVKLALVGGRRQPDVELPPGIIPNPAEVALQAIGAQHRLALMLRYVDDLRVADVARLLGKSVRATESLLARARTALRAAYEEQSDAS
jgi:RNA polymerase sigma-70 factor (ECF subfamily)